MFTIIILIESNNILSREIDFVKHPTLSIHYLVQLDFDNAFRFLREKMINQSDMTPIIRIRPIKTHACFV